MSDEKALAVKEVLVPELIDPTVHNVEQAIQAQEKIYQTLMQYGLKATSTADWIDQNGKPYLQASGAEKVARRLGVRIYDVVQEREQIEDEKGKYYVYLTTGKAALGNMPQNEIETIGTCSSRDKFFGKVNGELKATEDVDITNIRKKSYTNFIGNAITRLLGMRNLTWEQLERHGITRAGKASVQYKPKAVPKQDPMDIPPPPEEPPPGAIVEGPKPVKGKMPYWEWQPEGGKHYIYARLGKHFPHEFLVNNGMKPKDNDPKLFWAFYSDDLKVALESEFAAREME